MNNKLYLMLVNQEAMALLLNLSSRLQFIEVEGMDIGDNNAYKILITPVKPPVTPQSQEVRQLTPPAFPPELQKTMEENDAVSSEK